MTTAFTRRALLGSALGAAYARNAIAAAIMSDAEFTRAATITVERIEREDGFSGVILVARGNQVLLRKAAGFADRERGIRNTPETPFPLELVTRQFTAAAIMLLVQDRKVSIDDPISKYYPANPSAWNDITVKHLLTHSSGIGDRWFTDAYIDETARRLHTYQDAVLLAVSEPLLFPPGMGFQYSNVGYMLLAGIIERAAGQLYQEFLHDRIFAPLGMRNSVYGALPVDALKGYIRSPENVWKNGRTFEFGTGPRGRGRYLFNAG